MEKQKSENVITKLKTILKKQILITFDVFECEIVPIFLEGMGYPSQEKKMESDGSKYQIEVANAVLIQCYENAVVENALSQMSIDLCKGKNKDIKWGILFHQSGIWLINSDIEPGNRDFKSQGIVFEIVFGKNKNLKYFKYFSYDNLVGKRKNTNFFRDIITYKNTKFKGSEKSWPAYHTALKCFLDYCIEYCGITYFDESIKGYDLIRLNVFERYLKEKTKTSSVSTIKNQYFYVKSFMMCYTDNREFDKGSEEITKRFLNLQTRQNGVEEELDKNKLDKVFRLLAKGRNGLRNEVLLLLLVSFGIERRRLCTLKWDDIIKDREQQVYLKINNQLFKMPTILGQKVMELEAQQKGKKKYVFGNSKTKYIEPLPEGGVNTILSKIAYIDSHDDFYKQLTPAQIRRWLVKYLLKSGYRLQDIISMLEISISSLGNYISDKELNELSRKHNELSVTHPLEDFF